MPLQFTKIKKLKKIVNAVDTINKVQDFSLTVTIYL